MFYDDEDNNIGSDAESTEEVAGEETHSEEEVAPTAPAEGGEEAGM